MGCWLDVGIALGESVYPSPFCPGHPHPVPVPLLTGVWGIGENHDCYDVE